MFPGTVAASGKQECTEKFDSYLRLVQVPLRPTPAPARRARTAAARPLAPGARHVRAPWHVQTDAIVLTDRLLPCEVSTTPPLDGTLCGGHLAGRRSKPGDPSDDPIHVAASVLRACLLCPGPSRQKDYQAVKQRHDSPTGRRHVRGAKEVGQRLNVRQSQKRVHMH